MISHRFIPGRFLRFLCVGALGFAIDAGLTMTLTFEAGWSAFTARVPAFLLATLVTYELNRRWTFRVRTGRWHQRYAAYLVAVGAGTALNYATYAALIALQGAVTHIGVLLATMAGSVVALVFNFLAMRYGVFRQPNSGQHPWSGP